MVDSPHAASPVSSDEWAIWRAFTDMRRGLDLALENQLQRDADISGADYAVLISLLQAPDRQLRVGDLGRTLLWEKSRVSHQVSRMERRGLVERRDCASDARGTWVGITPAGGRAALRATREHGPTLRRLFFDLVTPEQLAAIGAASERVLEALQPATDAACEAAEAADVEGSETSGAGRVAGPEVAGPEVARAEVARAEASAADERVDDRADART
ncbi:MarR family winged helix-turn-helix transcriptional regulator [Galbitalea sp. SE-J8]|uniref:MarR family winged helix-turn-helix transcriptional regulator n=1 Tax=Galbitalea sp. SE-J8 TaxID=3054952 RepID=UPI00259CA5CC|nr:MarR family winged helix-turn-helix transcriptional regulator [Galbitalea sp. SE-J8]MDM4763338.1 MarR family winged helix-turn-helix transcriptional regulator [Galbitalea sp. SE-J8]